MRSDGALPATSPPQVVNVDEQGGKVTLRSRPATHAVHPTDAMGGPIEFPRVWAFQADDREPSIPGPIQRTARTAGNSWLEHVDEQGRHHALAIPADVDDWSQKLLNGERSRRYCYEFYFVRIYQFYEYLKTSYQHPHLYNPFLLAAIEYETTLYLWLYRIDSRPEIVDRE